MQKRHPLHLQIERLCHKRGVSLGTSKSSSESQQNSTQAASSHVTAGRDLTIVATGDGSQATATKYPQGASPWNISAKADYLHAKGTGNFNIASLQDTSTYQAKQSSAGFSINVPVGGAGIGGSVGASKSNTNSNYASVNEQSGPKAGDGGFQVNVNGNTNLKGGAITSTKSALDNVLF